MYFSSYHERVQNFPFFAQYLLLRRLQHRLWVVPHLQSEVFPYFNTSSKESDIRPSFSQNDVPEKRMFQFGIKMEITWELEIVLRKRSHIMHVESR